MWNADCNISTFQEYHQGPAQGTVADSDLSGGTSLIVIRGNVRHKLR